MPSNNPLDQGKNERVSRLQAQRALGLFAQHDCVMALGSLAGFVSCFAYWLLASEPDLKRVIIGLLVVNTFLLGWLVVVGYRALVFILDLHADVALMPEASARIAVGFLQGQPLKK